MSAASATRCSPTHELSRRRRRDYPRQRGGIRFGVLLGVLGVVYGDIGTSPLYAFRASLDHFGEFGAAAGTCSAFCR